MARALAAIFAVIFTFAACIVAVFVGDAVIAFFLGLAAGAVVVMANVLTHPLLFGWRS